MHLEIVCSSKMRRCKLVTIRVKVVNGNRLSNKPTIRCKNGGGTVAVFINNRTLIQADVETNNEFVSVFTIKPYGCGALILVFSLVDEDEEVCPSHIEPFWVAEQENNWPIQWGPLTEKKSH